MRRSAFPIEILCVSVALWQKNVDRSLMGQQWILRKGSKERGFQYVTPSGRKIRTKADLERIDALRIPPAWKEVHVAVSSRSPVQAWGFDARGRKQYRYHTRAVEKGELAKHYRVRQLASDLPKLRRTLRDDFRPRRFLEGARLRWNSSASIGRLLQSGKRSL